MFVWGAMTHQEKLFQMLLDVLVECGEHGGRQMVDGRSEAMDVVLMP